MLANIILQQKHARKLPLNPLIVFQAQRRFLMSNLHDPEIQILSLGKL